MSTNKRRRIPAALMIFGACVAATAMAAVVTVYALGMAPANGGSIARFLRSYLGRGGAPPGSTSFAWAEVEAGETRRGEAVVYLEGQGWCGSGGCTMLVLAPTGDSFRVIGRTTLVRLPIRVLPTSSNGRADLAVTVGGGGIMHPYRARLRFNGERYPSNPTVPPASRIPGAERGEAAIPQGAKTQPLR